MRACILLVLTMGLMGCGGSPQPPATSTINRVLIVSIDGLRPDVALRADTRHLRELYESGSFTFWAKTLDWPVTLPSHASMLTGVLPEKHGVWTNSDSMYIEMVRPQVPTLFEVSKAAGYTTAFVSGKSKFRSLTKPGTLDWSYVPPISTSVKDPEIAERAVEIIRRHRPQVMFVHLPGVDGAGHRHGWGSAEQLKAVQTADRALGRIVAEIKRQEAWDQTVVLVTADHGGTGQSHWRDDDRNTHIPWILRGPRVKKNLDLARYQELTIRTCDTYATICYLLGIPIGEEIDGKPVRQALEEEELMYNVPY